MAVCSRKAQGLAVPFGRRRKMGEIRVDRGWPGVDRLVGLGDGGRERERAYGDCDILHHQLA